MIKKEFIEKYGIDESSVYHYKEKFPEILVENKIDFGKLDAIIQEREEVEKKVKRIMRKRKAKDIEFLFKTNANILAHQFLAGLQEKRKQIIIQDASYKKYLQIIEKFSEEDVTQEAIAIECIEEGKDKQEYWIDKMKSKGYDFLGYGTITSKENTKVFEKKCLLFGEK